MGEFRAFDPAEHPRDPGGPGGGQFTTGSSNESSPAKKTTSKSQPKTPPRSTGHGGSAKPAGPLKSSMHFDAKSGRGPGYGTRDGDPHVHEIQRALNRLGLRDADGKALVDDGKLGPKTTAAIKRAQRALGLSPDGVLTPALYARLTAAKALPGRRSDEGDWQAWNGRSTLEGQMDAVERRYTLITVEPRGASDGTPRIGGYAAMFERTSQNLGGFVEVVERSFFNKSRGDGWPDVMCRYNHDDNMLLGTTGAGTLRLSIDDTGLDYEVTPPNARADVVELVGRGDIRKSSFAFRVPSGGEEWGLSEQGYPMRHLVTGRLIDVAPVNAPAYLDTTSALRSLARIKEADVDDVRSLAQEDELRKFFIRTDIDGGRPPAKKLLGAAAAVALMARRADPWE